MDSIDALGHRPDRSAAFTGDLLSEQEDEELRAIVEEAARDLSTPMALVNLVLENIQFFKAHHGLPPDLVAARGTDRDVSFCQFVVREGQPFEVVDAEQDERVPKHLVKYYGIRSYLGMPIIVNETIVGSLCVIDTVPREFSEQDHSSLKRLASLVNTRLAELAARRRQSKPDSRAQPMATALAELKKSLMPIREEIILGRSANLAIGAFLRLMEHSLKNEAVSSAVIEKTMQVAKEALSNSQDRFYDIDVSADHATASLAVLENILNRPAAIHLADVARAGLELMEPALIPIGGGILSDDAPELLVATPRPLAIAVFSASLGLLAAQMAARNLTDGLRAHIRGLEEQAGLFITTKRLHNDVYRELAEKVAEKVGEHPTMAIRQAEASLCLVFNLAAGQQ